MNILAWFRSAGGKLLHPSQTTSELDEEMRAHLEMRADDLQRSGLDRREAERRARIEFGGYTRFREECHEALGGTLLEATMQDVRYSLRTLGKSPSFVVAAVVTLALAIGANVIVFGLLDALVLRPLNVPEAKTLYGLTYGANPGWQSYANYVDLRDKNHSFEDLAGFGFAFVGLNRGQNPEVSSGFAVTSNYFDVLGVRPYLGRFFHRSDEHGPNSVPYVVLSYAEWHGRFQDDKSVIGRVVLINKHPFTVIGVAPRGFVGTVIFVSPDFFLPIVNQEQLDGENALDSRSATGMIFESFGHLKPGVTPAQAAADVDSVGAYLRKTYPKEFSQQRSTLSRMGLTAFRGAVQAFVGGLMLLAALILLAACANLGSLFAARAADRSRELALRLALGSNRRRILRQLLIEAVLIGLAGGAVGLAGSVVLLNKLSVWRPFGGAPLHFPVQPNLEVYVVSLLLAVLSGLLCGLVPIGQVLRANPYEVVKAGSGARLGRQVTIRDVLLVLQISLCAVLVTASLVAVRGLERSLHSDFGFEPHDAMAVGTTLAMAGYQSGQIIDMQKRMINALKSIPGVEQVGLVNNYPPLTYTAGEREKVYHEQARELTPASADARPFRYDVSPEYFAAAGTRLLAGRTLSWHDEKDTPLVAVVNAEFARRMLGSVTQAVGRHVKLMDGSRVEVIGVVEDGRYVSLTESQEPAMFFSFLQKPASASYMIVRSRRDPQQLTPAIRAKLRELDTGLPSDIQTWHALLEVVLFPSRMATVSLGVMGVMGAILSIIGIFGMAAYSVSKRLRELGIRVALGAQRREVLQTALGRAAKLLAVGSAAGLLLGLLATRVLASIVYQASPRDPLVLAGAVLSMLLVGLVATWIPAHRALSLDPLILLREE